MGFMIGGTSKFEEALYRRKFAVAPVKTLRQKLIKIDFLLSHVKLNKMRTVTHQSEQKKLAENRARKPKPTRFRKTENQYYKNRLSAGFTFIEN
jgi:hypothetical protein